MRQQYAPGLQTHLAAQATHCREPLGTGEAAALASLPLRLQDDAVRLPSAVLNALPSKPSSLICVSDLLASVLL